MAAAETLHIKFDPISLSREELYRLYKHMKESRLIEEKMLILLRQGKISKWFSGMGQEAIAVGATLALEQDEYIFPMHRNLGVFTSREVSFKRLFCQWQGKKAGFTKGRDRSFHFGTNEYNIVGMISHLGPQLSLASGVALAAKNLKKKQVSLAFTGEGGTSQGEFHEALNVASVWKLPVIFLVENNGYGLSTPISQQYNCKDIVDRALGYGMRSKIIDGNNAIEVYSEIKKIAAELRLNPEPVLIECKTFRMRGHEEASGVKYVPKELLEAWGRKDPVVNLEQFMLEEGLLKEDEKNILEDQIKKHIQEGLDFAFAQASIESNPEREQEDLFQFHSNQEESQVQTDTSSIRFVDAISNGLEIAMKRHNDLVLMGQDIADYGGVFKITEGFLDKFGPDRVRNTPLCESAIIGIAAGLSIAGIKSMVELQFADFVTCGFNQIINNLAKMHYRWGQNMDVVLRMPTGADVGAGPFHSQSNEAWFTHTAGLKVVYPSSPYDAKGLLLAAFEDPNPVMFFEHKALYRNISGEVPNGYYTIEIGKANLVQEGEEISVISYGAGVHWAMDYFDKSEVKADILDLRSLAPLDYDAIDATVKKTGRVLILQEDVQIGGIGSDISAYISEYLFEYLDAPVKLCASLFTPVPFAKNLEDMYLPKQRIQEYVDALMQY